MASTLTVRLNDEATPKLEGLDQALQQTGRTSAETGRELTRLSEVQREHVRVIHEHRGSVLQFAGSSVGALGSVAAAWLQLRNSMLWINTIRTPLELLHRGARSTGDQLGHMARQGAAATRFIPRFGAGLSNLATIATGATVTFGAFDAVLARTGRTAKQTTDELGKTTTQIESNLDRLRKAQGDLAGNVKFIVGDVGSLLGEAAKIHVQQNAAVQAAAAGLKEVDRAATATTNQMIANLEELSGVADAAYDSIFGAGARDRVRQQEQINKAQQAAIDDFERLRSVHSRFAAEQADAAERRRIAAIETIGDIELEIHAQRKRAGELAAADNFSAEQAEVLHRTLTSLEQRRTEIVQAETEKRKQAARDYTAFQKELRTKFEEDEQAHANRLHEIERKRFEQARALWQQRVDLVRGLVHTAEQQAFENAIASMEAEGATAEDLHHARMAQIDAETQQRIEAADTAESREAAFYEGQRRRLQEEGAFQRRQLAQQVQDREKAAEEAKRIEREKLDQIKRMLQDQGGPSGKDLLNQQDPRKVLAQLQQQRAEAAARKFREGYGPRDLSDARAERRFDAGEQAARRQAEQQAFRDFRSGKVNPEELANAQVQATNQMLSGLQQNGQLSQQSVQALSELARTAAIEQVNVAQLQQQVEQLQKHVQETQQGSNQTRAKIGGLKR